MRRDAQPTAAKLVSHALTALASTAYCGGQLHLEQQPAAVGHRRIAQRIGPSTGRTHG